MDSESRPQWEHLGQLLAERRARLDTRFTVRKTFAQAVGLNLGLIRDVENAERDNYKPPTRAAIEKAYQWAPGSFQRVLDGEDPIEIGEASGAAAFTPSEPADTGRDRYHEADVMEALDVLRLQAEALELTLGDVLVRRGLATPEELTISDEKRHDPIVKEILESNLTDDTKDFLLQDYAERRRAAFRAAGVPDKPLAERKKPRGS